MYEKKREAVSRGMNKRDNKNERKKEKLTWEQKARKRGESWGKKRKR